MTKSIHTLVLRWNKATCPYVFRSDNQHERCKKLARCYITMIRNHSDFQRVQMRTNGSLFVR